MVIQRRIRTRMLHPRASPLSERLRRPSWRGFKGLIALGVRVGQHRLRERLYGARSLACRRCRREQHQESSQGSRQAHWHVVSSLSWMWRLAGQPAESTLSDERGPSENETPSSANQTAHLQPRARRVHARVRRAPPAGRRHPSDAPARAAAFLSVSAPRASSLSSSDASSGSKVSRTPPRPSTEGNDNVTPNRLL